MWRGPLKQSDWKNPRWGQRVSDESRLKAAGRNHAPPKIGSERFEVVCAADVRVGFNNDVAQTHIANAILQIARVGARSGASPIEVKHGHGPQTRNGNDP